jgi:phosphoserine phosphatase
MSELVLDIVRRSDNYFRDNSAAGSTFNLPASMPLAVDLDRTLISGDMLQESVFSAVCRNPFVLVSSLLWLVRGRAAIKREFALRYRADWDRIKLHQDVLELILREKGVGRPIVLATAADALIAEKIADHLGLFDRVLASDGRHNLKGAAKAQALAELYPGGFIYAGDSQSDLAVWQRARGIVVVGAHPSIAASARALGRPMIELRGRTAS